jgi:predicted nucleotidyltransferase
MGVEEAVTRLKQAADDGGLEQLCRRHGVRVLTLFGSARTDPASARDLDVAVSFGRRATSVPVELVVAELMDLTGTDRVDVLVLDRATPTARFAGLVDGTPLYEAEAGEWACAQMAAALEFYETEWLRRLDLELLSR